MGVRGFSSGASSQPGAFQSWRVELQGWSHFPALKHPFWEAPTDPLFPLPSEVAQLWARTCHQERKGWGKKGVFAFRKSIPFTPKSNTPTVFRPEMYTPKRREKDGFVPFCPVRASPKIYLPSLLWEHEKGLLLTPCPHKTTARQKVFCCRFACILTSGKVIFLLLRFCFALLVFQPLHFSC